MYRSTEHSRIRASRSQSRRGAETPIPDPTNVLLTEGVVTDEATELLHEFIHPYHHHAEQTLIGGQEPDSDDDNEEAAELEARSRLPWWKRPSPAWLLAGMPLSSLSFSMTMAPRIEIYTQLACAVHAPLDFDSQAITVLDIHDNIFTPDNAYPEMSHSYANTTVELIFDSPQLDELAQGRSNKCASNPVVQAEVAKLTTTMAAFMGVLACLTTAWWGALSDRIGRTRVLGITLVGLLSNDVVFLVVFYFFRTIPGGYWFLVVGPIIEGCLGGMTGAGAAIQAYFADTTTRATRSRVLSLSLGLVFIGMGIGPILGGLVIRFSGRVVSVFYITLCSHLISTSLVWGIVPESLTTSQKRKSREARDEAASREINSRTALWMHRIFGFLSPLSVFMPNSTTGPNLNPLKAPKRNWNLTLVAFAYGFTLSLIGSYSFKFQYAAAQFDWSSETIGYWLSIVGITRAVFLTMILPVIIKFFKSKPAAIAVPEAEPLVSSEREESPSSHSVLSSLSVRVERHSPVFELNLARCSLVLDAVSYILMALSTRSAPFAGASVIGSLGAGFAPALQTVALELHTQRGGTEAGKLFGALSVVQSLSSQIIGPALYGFVFVNTVSTFPSAIFWMGVISISLSLICLLFIRLANLEHQMDAKDDEESIAGHLTVREAALVDVADNIASK